MKPDIKLLPCIFCKEEPRIIHYDENMWYVRCPCGKYERYEFLGYTKEGAIESWNYANRPINRTPPPKKKKGEQNVKSDSKKENICSDTSTLS